MALSAESVESVGHFPSMSSFPLLTLPVHLVEAIITKTDSISNFRLRRTCRDVHDLIQTSHRISVFVKKSLSIERDVRSVLQLSIYINSTDVAIDAEACYGIRLEYFHPPRYNNKKTYIQLYQFLKKYRITCATMEDFKPFSPDQIVTLLKLLKPTVITHYTCSSVRLLDAILSSKTLRRVDVREVDPSDAVFTVSKLVSYFPQIGIDVGNVWEPAPLLHEVSKALLSMDLSNVSHFYLFTKAPPVRPTKIQLEQDFPGLQWEFERDDELEHEEFNAWIDTPPHFPPGSSWKFNTFHVDWSSLTLYSIEYFRK